MAEAKAGHVRNFRRRGARVRQSARGACLRGAAALALALLSACFTAEPYTEHLCRTCVAECPEGLTCHDQRCVPVCDSSCTGDHHCDGDACVPLEGEACPERSVSLALCVGQDSEVVAAAPAAANAEGPWVVLDSRLPEGVSFDPETGMLSGSPARAEPGSITVRQGAPGNEEVNVEIASELCPQIETTTIHWCRGKDETAQLVPSLPGSYEWHVSSGSLALQVQGDVLSGNVAESGSYPLQIELLVAGSVVRRTIELSVSDCGGAPPERVQPLAISSLAALPDACQGVDYGAQFAATGGVPNYRWTLQTALAGLVLEQDTGRLTGSPLASGDFELTVSVEDAAGNGDSITTGLHVLSDAEACITSPLGPSEEEACNIGDTSLCPRPPLEIVTTDLGVACAGDNFSARLEATGGGGNYQWYLSDAAPIGLELERTGELHGVPTADAVGKYQLSTFVTSTLIDRPVYGTVTLEIVPCDGLVFLTDAANAGQLFLASTSGSRVSELSQGVLGAGEGVHSFALSTDGVHLAFEVASESAPSRLYWVDLTTQEARLPTFAPALPEGASVIDYRWSLDGSQLAATFRAGDDVFLGVSPAGGALGSSIYLGGRYRSGLFWAAERICYIAPGLREPFLGVLCHALTPEGVEDQAPLTGGFDPINFRADLLLSSDEGYFALLPDPVAPSAQFLLPDEVAASTEHIGRVFSPALHRAAGPSADASIFEVVTSRGWPLTPKLLALLDPCDKLDAWSFDERSIACRSGDSLAIHALGPDGELARSSSVQGSAGYPEEEFRRLWAPGGQWYAYDANDALRVVSLGDAAPRSRLIFEAGSAPSPYAGLGTDASGAHLYYHHGSRLEVFDTVHDFAVHNVNGDVLLSDPAPCNEAQLDDGPRLWCGAQSTPSFFFPDPSGARVAFVDRQNLLYLADIAAGNDAAGDVATGAETSSEISSGASPPRLVHPSHVKCTMDSGETACDNFVQWVPRREPE